MRFFPLLLSACYFLSTLMGAGGHQVARTETATFNSTIHHTRKLVHLGCILILFHGPLIIMVVKYVLLL